MFIADWRLHHLQLKSQLNGTRIRLLTRTQRKNYFLYIYIIPPRPPLYSENDDDENGGDNKINEE